MPEVTHHANFLETPAQRIFAELDGISKYQERDKFKDRGPANDVERSMTVSEDKVVNTYRRGLDVNDFETLSFFNASSFADFSLMEEVQEKKWTGKDQTSDEGGRGGNED
ncbi:hypothetical protein GLOIN_2v1844859 [Rhizophagus irregularis DAOM 181602=DAOM 197198]|nr:hypothetical protein GLOIN_2v1844859 [Rhizophagus irregularis DAOM 181602=DAOM 197198]